MGDLGDQVHGHGGKTQRTERSQVEDMEAKYSGQRGHKPRTWRKYTGDKEDTSRGHGGNTQRAERPQVKDM